MNSESDLRDCFREIDRPEVELGPELRFPLEVEDLFAWTVGPRAFLLFRDRPDRPLRGIVFHRDGTTLPDAVAMCEWCHAVRGHGRVKLLSAWSGEKRRVGLYLCSDLGCVQGREVPGTDDVPERLDRDERTRRMLGRIRELAARRLF